MKATKPQEKTHLFEVDSHNCKCWSCSKLNCESDTKKIKKTVVKLSIVRLMPAGMRLCSIVALM